MAKLVMAAGVPHRPWYPGEVLQHGPEAETGALFRKVAEQVEAANPDLIVFFDSDHLVSFFLDNMPAFCIGLAEEARGPTESWVDMPRYTVRMHDKFARGLFEYALDHEFDPAGAEELKLEHGMMVPLHFLNPKMEIPVVPVYVRGHIPPLPTARRCVALGRLVREFIEAWPGNERVAVMASGEFSFDVGTPRAGTFEPEWSATVVDHLQNGRVEELARRATTEQMLAAGNVSGELLNFIAMAAAVGDRPPDVMLPRDGHAFMAWRLD